MKTIPLTRGYTATVDDEDYERLSAFKWQAMKKGKLVYATRNLSRDAKGHRKRIYMHREILRTSPELKTDHIDGDGCNNQKENLRSCSAAQNRRSFMHKNKNTSSRFRGVRRRTDCDRWEAKITVENKFLYLGFFKSEEDAARAYDAAAKKYFEEFASPNFP